MALLTYPTSAPALEILEPVEAKRSLYFAQTSWYVDSACREAYDFAWKSSNKKYAAVNRKGKVFTKKAGKGKKVQITASSTDGTKKKAVITISIK